MPQHLPQIPAVDKQTSYQKLKSIVEKLRAEFLRSYLFDSTSVTITDNPGKGRSAEVNFSNQGNGALTFTVTADGTETVPNGGGFRIFQINPCGLPDGTPVAVDDGGQLYPIIFAGAYVASDTINVKFWSVGGAAFMTAATITVRAIK